MPKRTQIAIVAAAAIGVVPALGSLATAEPSETEQKLSSAREQARLITDRINGQSASIAGLEAEARTAAAREAELRSRLRQSTARSNALTDDLLAAERELDAVRARYKRAVGVLSERLVEIYKGSQPDYLTVLLEADGFEQLESRASYLEALTEADERIADRVGALHEQVLTAYREIAELKASIDRESRRLEAARAELEAARAAAERRAAEIADARASERAALSELQRRISGWELEVRREAAEELGGGAYLGGPYSIPTYIVMCESGGNYRALNPSSMAGGAYQIIPSTWRAYGGRGPYAHLASKAEQDRIAAIIWREDGPGAWSCA